MKPYNAEGSAIATFGYMHSKKEIPSNYWSKRDTKNKRNPRTYPTLKEIFNTSRFNTWRNHGTS